MYGTYAPFFVAPKSTLAEPPGEPSSLNAHSLLIRIVRPAEVDRRLKISVRVHNTSGGALQAIPIVLYDGEPESGGEIIDYQTVGHIPAEAIYVLRTFFVPRTAGEHTIVGRLGRPDANPVVASQRIMVRPSQQFSSVRAAR